MIAAATARAEPNGSEGAEIGERPHITIVGEARVEVAPDLAEISVGARTERLKAIQASAETARIAKAVIDAAKAQGVDSKDIRTQAVTLNEVFDDIRDANGHITDHRSRGFSAGTTIAVRVRALDQAGALAQSLIEQGATQFNGIRFSVENPAPIEDRLLVEAARDAQEKAKLAAAALGAKLGRVLMVGRPGGETGGFPRAGSLLRAAAPAIPLEAGMQTLRSQMEVTWALEP